MDAQTTEDERMKENRVERKKAGRGKGREKRRQPKLKRWKGNRRVKGE